MRNSLVQKALLAAAALTISTSLAFANTAPATPAATTAHMTTQANSKTAKADTKAPMAKKASKTTKLAKLHNKAKPSRKLASKTRRGEKKPVRTASLMKPAKTASTNPQK